MAALLVRDHGDSGARRLANRQIPAGHRARHQPDGDDEHDRAGREVRYVLFSVEDFVAELVARGLSPEDAKGFADMVEPIRKGTDEYLSDGVERALGRPARTFAEFAKTTAEEGGWAV
jgi:hypothetical protein